MISRRAAFAGALATLICVPMVAQASVWVDLGRRRVQLSRDADRIAVADDGGIYTKLRLAVDGNAIYLRRATVRFANGAAVSYRFDAMIAPGGRTVAVDLPGDARQILHVDLHYRRRAGGGAAVVTLQGLRR